VNAASGEPGKEGNNLRQIFRTRRTCAFHAAGGHLKPLGIVASTSPHDPRVENDPLQECASSPYTALIRTRQDRLHGQTLKGAGMRTGATEATCNHG
jgi:hypothetical protein